jgi:hypothetical protein
MAVTVGNTGFSLRSKMVKEPPKNMYPGETGEAVYELSNTGGIPIVFRISGENDGATPEFLSADPNDPTYNNQFGFVCSLTQANGADIPLYESRDAGRVHYYGFLDTKSSKLVKVRFKVAGAQELTGKTEKVGLEIEACQSLPEAVDDYFGLNEALDENGAFWAKVKAAPAPAAP